MKTHLLVFISVFIAAAASASPGPALERAYETLHRRTQEGKPSQPPEPARFSLGPDASKVLAEILDSSEDLRPWVLGAGLRPGEKFHGADCDVVVKRPALADPPQRDPDNRIECVESHRPPRLPPSRAPRLSLRDAGVEFWGSRFDKGHSVSFSGDMAERLTAAISKAYHQDKENPVYWVAELWGPPGQVVIGMEFFALNREPRRDSVGAVICSRDKELDQRTGRVTVVKTMCVLLDPAK